MIGTEKVILKSIDTVTYCSSASACVLSFLNSNAAGLGVLIALLSLIIGTGLNWHWQKKRYQLEAKKHEHL